MENIRKQVLLDLITALDQKNFDLEAWKIRASLIIKKLFGENDEKYVLIKNLKYDYSSWNLRDNSGGNQHDAVKIKARGIIESAITEISLVKDEPYIMKVVTQELTGFELSALKQCIHDSDNVVPELEKFVEGLAVQKKNAILTQLILGSSSK
ncbi:MAG: hypothetical protein KA807_03120 [Prolixibacteraceae bacterium]|nr:hypothetical protein [Prolixibacteraceae bacterium]